MTGDITANPVRSWSCTTMGCPHHETALTRLWTNHTRLTHVYIMSFGVQPNCDDCLIPLTVRHLLIKCPSLRVHERAIYLPVLGR